MMAAVYIVYLDDSGTTEGKGRKRDPLQVVAAVIVKDEEFMHVEDQRDFVLKGLTKEGIVVPEIHACDILGRRGLFKDLTQKRTNGILKSFLGVVRGGDVPIVYGAVDTRRLADQPYGSAKPIDMAFRLCAAGVERWFEVEAVNEMGIFVIDGGQHTKCLPETYRIMRKGPVFQKGGLAHMHDDMYRGESVYSAGLQLADACALVILRHLKGNRDSEDVYRWIEGSISHGEVQPAA